MVRLQGINPGERHLSRQQTKSLTSCSRSLRLGARREHPLDRRIKLSEVKDHTTRHPWLSRSRAAALGFGLGATLALSPLVWADNPLTPTGRPQATPAAPETMTSPIALIQHESFAPLVKKVSPAVVNISVTQKAAADATAEQPEITPSPFPNSPFDEFLRRFFDQQMPNGGRHLFPQMPEGQARRIALGSGFIIDPSGYVVTNS